MKQAEKKVIGRPKLKPEERRKEIEVTLRRETIELARGIGGNVSRGIEMAVEYYWQKLMKEHNPSKPLISQPPKRTFRNPALYSKPKRP